MKQADRRRDNPFVPSGGALALALPHKIPLTTSCTTCYLSYDQLGSTREITDQNGNVVARHDYLPYGEELIGGTAGRTDPAFGKSATVTQMFTGQERDGGTADLDYFNARHFSAYVGGFMQADPANAGANIMSPQSWNGYGYVLGNPLGLVDPSGMTTCTVANDYCSTLGKRPSSEFGNLNPFGPYALSSVPTLTGAYTISNTGLSITGLIDYTGTASIEFVDLVASGTTNYTFFLLSLSSPGGFNGAPAKAFSPQPLKSTSIRLAIPPWQNPLPKYCGPGTGSGTPANQVDAACQAHDQCYQNGSVSGADIFLPKSPSKAAAINACDAQLCKRLATISPQNRTENGDAFFVGLFFSVSHGSLSACIP